jgi:hypothetical protein
VNCPVTLENGSTLFNFKVRTLNLDGGLTVIGTNTLKNHYESTIRVRTNPITNAAAGAKLLLTRAEGAPVLELEVASPGFSGTWEVNDYCQLRITADGAINSNATVIVNSGGTLIIGAAQTGAAPLITAKSGGSIASEVNTDTGWKIRLEGGVFRATDLCVGTLNHSGAMELAGGSGKLSAGWSGALQLSGQVTEATPGMKLEVAPQANPVILSHTNNLHTGGTDIVEPLKTSGSYYYSYAEMKDPGAFGSGPIRIVPNTNDNNKAHQLRLVKTGGPADWTLTNDLGGAGMIKVEDGSYRLTVRGGAVSPGINTAVVSTNTTGILTVWGSLAFTNNGAQYAQLNMEIAGTNNVAGVDYDRLTVSNSIAGLGYAGLTVNINTNLTAADLAGKGFTIVTCTNNLTGLNFQSVSYSGKWSGAVLYGSGYVALTNLTICEGGTIYVIR